MRTTTTDAATRVQHAATALAARARAERAGDLSLTQVAVLGRIATHGPITPGELADQLRMLPQSLTRPIGSLERAGFLRRTADPADGRVSLLKATASGLSALRTEMAPRTAWVAEAMAAVCTAAERDTLLRAAAIMERLVDFGGGVAPHEP